MAYAVMQFGSHNMKLRTNLCGKIIACFFLYFFETINSYRWNEYTEYKGFPTLSSNYVTSYRAYNIGDWTLVYNWIHSKQL